MESGGCSDQYAYVGWHGTKKVGAELVVIAAANEIVGTYTLCVESCRRAATAQRIVKTFYFNNRYTEGQDLPIDLFETKIN